MKLSRAAWIVLAVLAVFAMALASVALSVKGDLEEMQGENTAIFVVNPESRRVELGFIVNTTGEALLLSPVQRVQNTTLDLGRIFANSERAGAEALVGSELWGAAYSRGRIAAKAETVDRVVLVEDTLVAELFSLQAPSRVEAGEEGGLLHARAEVNSSQLVSTLRGDFEAVEWEVQYYGEARVEKLTSREFFLKFGPGAAVKQERERFADMLEWGVKSFTLMQAGDMQVDESLGEQLQSREFRGETFKMVLEGYREGKIRTYPANTLTSVLRYLPERVALSLSF